MSQPPSGPDDDKHRILADAKAARLLERASELDVARAAGSTIAELREAAAAAGISEQAFDAALAEMEQPAATPATVVATPHRSWWGRLVIVGGLVFTALTFLMMRASPSQPTLAPGQPIIEESVFLNCLTAREAAELIRPKLGQPWNTIVHSPAAPRVLTLRGTAQQLNEVKSLLDAQQKLGSPACTPSPTRP